MPAQHILYSVSLHPPRPHLTIRARAPLPRNEPIALEPPARHENEDAERRVAKPEALGQGFGETADEQIHRLDVVAVQAGEFLRDGLVAAGECEERGRGAHVEESAELVVARDAAFSVAQNVDGAEVDVASVGGM